MLKSKTKRKELRVRAPLDVCKWAEREARAHGVSLTAVVVDALEDHINRKAAEKAAKRAERARA